MTLKNFFKTCVGAKYAVLLFMTLGLIFFTAACGETELDSFWLDRDIVVDGKSNDWLDALYYFEEDDVSVGFFNDSEYLYICFLAEDYSQIRWLTGGSTLVFPPSGQTLALFPRSGADDLAWVTATLPDEAPIATTDGPDG